MSWHLSWMGSMVPLNPTDLRQTPPPATIPTPVDDRVVPAPALVGSTNFPVVPPQRESGQLELRVLWQVIRTLTPSLQILIVESCNPSSVTVRYRDGVTRGRILLETADQRIHFSATGARRCFRETLLYNIQVLEERATRNLELAERDLRYLESGQGPASSHFDNVASEATSYVGTAEQLLQQLQAHQVMLVDTPYAISIPVSPLLYRYPYVDYSALEAGEPLTATSPPTLH